MSLTITDLEAGYGDFTVLHGLSLTAAEGTISCLLGPNGSGKSTLMRVVTGLLAPRRGQVSFEGRPLNSRPPQEIVRAGIAYVPQRPSVFRQLTVHENLEVGAHTLERREVARRIEEVYGRFPRLAERRRQLAYSLSGGERRALEIGRALMLRPRLLLLDEPSLGLAPMMVDLVLEEIQRINAQGITVLMVEQNVHKALRIAHTLFVLRLGTIVFGGPAAQASEQAVQRLFLD